MAAAPRFDAARDAVARSLAGQRVLLTGHSGFKGAWLTTLLVELDAEVHGVSATPARASTVGAAADLGVADLVTSEHAIDIRDAGALDRVTAEIAPTVVLHLAAQPIVDVGWADRRTTYASNVLGTANVVEAALGVASTRTIVVATTDKVYANDERGVAFVETDRLGGDDPYAASKAAAEIIIEPYRRAELMGFERRPITTMRAGNVIGGGDITRGRLLPDIVAALGRGEPVTLRRPDAVRPWQHVLDCLWGYLAAAAATLDGVDIAASYNIAPDDGVRTVLDVARIAATRFGADPDAAIRVEQATTDDEHTLLSLDATKARTELGLRSAFTVEEAIAMTVDYARSDDPAAVARGQIEELLRRLR